MTLAALAIGDDGTRQQAMKVLQRVRGSRPLHITLLAVLYFLFGLVGLELAVPPGYASPIWPASGLALAALLIRGRGAWPGIFIGSLAVNLVASGTAIDDPAILPVLPTMLAIAAGSTLQIWLAAWLVTRFFGKPCLFDNILDIAKFALLAGPLGCLVAPTIAVSALYLSQAVNGADFVSNWINWWVGDFMGIWVISPIMLLGPWSQWDVRWKGYPVARFTASMVAGLCILIGSTLAAWQVASYTTYKMNQRSFETLVVDSEHALQYRLESYEQSLDSGAALLRASDEVTLDDWKSFVGTLNIDRSLPGINGLGIIKSLKRDELPQWIATLDRLGQSEIDVHPLTGRDEVFLISYIEPRAINEQAVGLDIAFEKNRRDAARRARDTGQSMITKRIILVQDAQNTPGFLLLRPYYDASGPISTVEQRRAAFEGWVYAPFIAKRFMAGLTANQGETFHISVYDGDSVDPDALIYSSAEPAELARKTSFTVTETMEFYGQKWTVRWTSTPAFLTTISSKEPLLILIGGLFLTLMFGILLFLYTRKQNEISRKVDEKTHELVEREKGLKEALFALGESEKRFSALAGMSPVGIFRTDPCGFCTFVNDAWLQVTGLTTQEAMGAGWLTIVHPDDRTSVHDDWLSAIGNEGSLRREFRISARDGSIKSVELISAPELNEDGKAMGFIGVVIDNSERKQAELAVADRDARLAFLVENMTDGIIRLSLDGEIKDVSRSMESIIGIPSTEGEGEVEVEAFAFQPHPDDAVLAAAEFNKLASGEAENVLSSYRILNQSTGEWQWIETSGKLIRNPEDGQPVSIILSVRNVDERRKLEEQIETALERAQAATKAKSEFLANMSHEIRTPMNGVIGFTELLLQSDVDEKQCRQLELILQSSKSMMHLLNDILDISKIEAGRIQLVEEPFILTEEIDHWIGSMEAVVDKKGLSLEKTLDPALPACIMGDRHRIRQIVMNLLGNAIKFTDHGRVMFSAREAGGKLVIEVEDTGIGIPPEQQEAIFGHFVQASSSAQRKYGGTGLGLAISRELARLMKGDLSIESEVGKGTSVRLEIPCQPVSAPVPLAGGEKAPQQAAEEERRKAKLLLVEDNDINREMICDMLQTIGIDADVAENGRLAVDLVNAARDAGQLYSLVLMDIQMPVMDGREATRRIRANGLKPDMLPIVALSANAYPEDIAECMACGMQAHLAKPVQLHQLREAVERWTVKPEGTSADTHGGNAPAKRKGKPGSRGADRIAGLMAKYNKRKYDLLQAARTATEKADFSEEQWAEFITALHGLAGTAGMFGEAPLGQLASRLEYGLGAAAIEDRADMLKSELAALEELIDREVIPFSSDRVA